MGAAASRAVCEPSAEHEAEVNTPVDDADAGADDGAPCSFGDDAVEVATSPHDPRFPATNQSRHCFTKYNEFYRCVAQKGEGAAECEAYQRAYRSICPSEWVAKWNEQRESGAWPGKY